MGFLHWISSLPKRVFSLTSVSFQNWTNGMLDVLKELILVPENWSRIVSKS